MREDEYAEHYPYSSLVVHAGAYFKDRFLPFSVLLGGLGKGGEGEGGGTGVAAPAGRKSSGTHLYSWFRRKPGRAYTVLSNEDSLPILGVATSQQRVPTKPTQGGRP